MSNNHLELRFLSCRRCLTWITRKPKAKTRKANTLAIFPRILLYTKKQQFKISKIKKSTVIFSHDPRKLSGGKNRLKSNSWLFYFSATDEQRWSECEEIYGTHTQRKLISNCFINAKKHCFLDECWIFIQWFVVYACLFMKH